MAPKNMYFAKVESAMNAMNARADEFHDRLKRVADKMHEAREKASGVLLVSRGLAKKTIEASDAFDALLVDKPWPGTFEMRNAVDEFSNVVETAEKLQLWLYARLLAADPGAKAEFARFGEKLGIYIDFATMDALSAEYAPRQKTDDVGKTDSDGAALHEVSDDEYEDFDDDFDDDFDEDEDEDEDDDEAVKCDDCALNENCPKRG